MMKLFTVLWLLLFSAVSFAESSKDFAYDGQNAESFELDLIKEITRYRSEDYQSTCERQIPYTDRVCGYETRYRRECRNEPGYNDCRTVNDQVCRNVTRTRRECTTGPARQECTTVPNMVCRQVDGRRVCSQQGTRQQCRNVPGRQTCRDVPYTDRVCTNQPRQVCTWIPSRQVCNDVPYQDYVCRDVTRYRTETYACTRTRQVPYQVERENAAEVLIDFVDQTAAGAKASVSAVLDREGNVSLSIQDRSLPEALIYVTKTQDIQNDDDNLKTNVRFIVTFVTKETYVAPVTGAIDVDSADSKQLKFKLEKVIRPHDLSIHLKMKKKGGLFGGGSEFEKQLQFGDFQVQTGELNSFVVIDFDKIGAEIKEGKKYEVDVNFKLTPHQSLRTPIRESLQKSVQFKKKL